jgi:DNA-binding NarL/FixJ family response regulator
MMPIRILIADDHPLLIDGLVRVLKEMDGVQVLEPVGNGRRLLARLQEAPADLVLLDLQMPQLDGLEALKMLREQFPQLKVLIFTNYHQPKLIREARSMGARGYLSKSSTSQTLKEAVATVARGGSWFAEEEVVDLPGDKNSFVDDFMRKYQITSREVEILRKIAGGYTTKEIGEQLFVSEFTVNAHRRNICRKLDIHTPAGLVSFAREHGLA